MSKAVIEDEALIIAIKNGGKERLKALESIYKIPGLKERIQNYVYYNNGKLEDGKDVFVESILIADRNIRADKFNRESSIPTYIYGIAKLYWSNQRRKVKRVSIDLDDIDHELTDHQNPELILIKDDLKEKLEQILQMLTDKCRKVLQLWSNDVKYAEIAKELKVENTSQLRKMKYDCQQKLKHALLARPELIPKHYHDRKRE